MLVLRPMRLFLYADDMTKLIPPIDNVSICWTSQRLIVRPFLIQYCADDVACAVGHMPHEVVERRLQDFAIVKSVASIKAISTWQCLMPCSLLSPCLSKVMLTPIGAGGF